jgi:hypothetical protein
MAKSFPIQTVLDLACAAQRINGDYIREDTPIYTSDNVLVGYKVPNKNLMLLSLDAINWYADEAHRPALLNVTRADREQAEALQKHFRKYIFEVIEGSNDFKTEINSLLNSEEIPENRFGYLACLPTVFLREVATKKIEKVIKDLDRGYLGNNGETLFDLDCEILESKKSKNFDAYNICAIINNKMVSWMTNTSLVPGPCVVVKCKIKEQTKNWKYGNDETRLNYVKAAQ